MQNPTPAFLAVAVLLALPQAAGAAAPFDVGSGNHPDVAVDSSGTAHVVWDEHDGGATGDTIGYCQIPAGGSSCALKTAYDPPADAIGRSTYVFAPSPDRIVIVTHRCCSPDATLAYVSTTGGSSFADPVTIGDLDMADAVYGPGDAVSGVDTGGRYQRMPLTGPQATQQAVLPAGFGAPTASAIALFAGTRPLKVSADGNDTTSSLHSGAGDPNDATTWTGPTAVAPPGGEPHLAGGPAGPAMIYRTGSPGQLHARKFDGAAFGAPTVLSSADPIEADLAADAGGRLQAAWVENGVVPNEVRIAASSDGATWSPPATIFRGDAVDDLFNTQVAAGADGKGLAVFDANSRQGDVTAIPLEPLANDQTPTATATVGDLEISFLAPTACVQPPEKVTLRVTSRRKRKLSPRLRVKVASVVFSVDRTKVKDKKAAFKAAFSTAAFPRGSKHKVGAVVTLEPVKGGTARTKRLAGAFNVCG
jgi:hypothetical protein